MADIWGRRYGPHPPADDAEIKRRTDEFVNAVKSELERRKTMATRCKVVCSFKDEENKNVHFHPVYTGSDENKQFFASTPGGVMSFNILNDVAFGQFEQGKEYYVDISAA